MSIEDYYFAGRNLLDQSRIHLAAFPSESMLFRIEKSMEDLARIDETNQRIEDIESRWTAIYHAIKERAQKMQDIEFLVSLLDDVYTEIHAEYVRDLDPGSHPPRLDLMAEAYRIQKYVAFVDQEHVTLDIHPDNLERFFQTKEEIERGLEWLYYLVCTGGKESANLELELRLAKENIKELGDYARAIINNELPMT